MTTKPVTYRELRNTPGKVYERLAAGEPLTLVADGEAKALLIPIEDGDVDSALDSWRRGRALLALSRLQSGARRAETATLTIGEIETEVKAAREDRRARER